MKKIAHACMEYVQIKKKQEKERKQKCKLLNVCVLLRKIDMRHSRRKRRS